VKEVVAFEGKQYDEVGIHLVEPAEISQLHAKFFDDSSVTDCISLPVSNNFKFEFDSFDTLENTALLGDVFVCTQVAVDYALKHQKDPYEEVTLYVIHGLLHLMGYDDIDKEERAAMRAAERRHMQHLKRRDVKDKGRKGHKGHKGL